MQHKSRESPGFERARGPSSRNYRFKKLLQVELIARARERGAAPASNDRICVFPLNLDRECVVDESRDEDDLERARTTRRRGLACSFRTRIDRFSQIGKTKETRPRHSSDAKTDANRWCRLRQAPTSSRPLSTRSATRRVTASAQPCAFLSKIRKRLARLDALLQAALPRLRRRGRVQRPTTGRDLSEFTCGF